MKVEGHKNVEKVIRYYLKYLPPRGVKSILDVGGGTKPPYKGILQKRCEKYACLDIREGEGVDFVCDITEITKFNDKEWEWIWCTETLEHIPEELEEKFITELLRISENIVFTFPTPIHPSFAEDPGHHEVKFDFDSLKDKYNIKDCSTKTGRRILIIGPKI